MDANRMGMSSMEKSFTSYFLVSGVKSHLKEIILWQPSSAEEKYSFPKRKRSVFEVTMT